MQPKNQFTLDETAEFTRLVEESIKNHEWEAFQAFCEARANGLKRAVRGWTALEELMRRSCIDELMWYSTPGVFSLRLSQVQGLDGFDLEGVDDGEEWDGRTLEDCLGAALEHIMDVEASEKEVSQKESL